MADLFEPHSGPLIAGSPAPGEEAISGLEGWFAKAKLSGLRGTSNFVGLRARDKITSELADRVKDRLPPETGPRGAGEMMSGINTASKTLKRARQVAAENPNDWADVDLSEEAIEKQVKEALKAEREDLMGIISMSSEHGVILDFAAQMAGTTFDIENLPFLLLGGGGSLMRVIAREALMNTAAEAVNMPSRFVMAERLEEPAPRVLPELAAAAVFGGAFGGVAHALTRGLSVFRDRNVVPEGLPQTPDTEAEINAVEDAIVSDARPTIAETAVRETESAPQAVRPEPRRVMPDRPEAPAGRRPTRLSTFIVQEGGIWRGDDTGELAGLDYRRPGFLKKNPREQSTAGNNGGGLKVDEMRERAVEAGYLDENSTVADFLDAVGQDVNPQLDNIYARYGSDVEWREYEEALAEWEEIRAQGGVIDTEPRVLTVDDIRAQADPDTYVGEAINEFLSETGMPALAPEDRAAVTQLLRENGGDVDSALERVYIQTIENELIPGLTDEPDFAEPETSAVGGPSGRGTEQPGPVAQEASDGGARPEGGPATGAFEATSAGDQGLIPGVEPVSQRQRLEAEMSRPMQGGAAAADDGLFDISGRSQLDMFSDPAAKEVRDAQVSALDDLRQAIEADGDFDLNITTEDGKTFAKASDLLRYADEGREFSEVIDLCGRSQ